MIDMGFESSVIEIFERIPASNMRPEDEDEETQDLRGSPDGDGVLSTNFNFMFSAINDASRRRAFKPGLCNDWRAQRNSGGEVVLWIPEGGKTRQLIKR